MLIFLKRVRNLITRPECWTQGTWARKADGSHVASFNPRAVCWCLDGAIRKIAQQRNMHKFYLEVDELMTEVCGHIVTYNDNHTHYQVLWILDRAIERVKNVG